MSKKAIFSWIATAGLLATSASALERTAALGSRGEIYLAKTGIYRSLFPTGNETDAANPVLAIEVTKASSSTQRFLVPFTKGSEPESSPALIYEDDSDRLFVVWESRATPLNSVLMLASFDGTHWTSPIQITGNPFSSKSSPQLAITRDSYAVPGEDGPVLRNRTVLHLIWEEEGAPGSFEFLYTPVILEEGTYLGWNPIYHLSDFVADGDSGSKFSPPLALIHAPVLQNGGDPRTTVVAFASSAGRWLTSLVIDVLPEELSQLSDGVRSSIIDIGRQGNFPGNRPALAEKAKADLVARGTAFHADVVRYMGDQVHDLILADQGNDLVALAGKVRSSIIDIGVRLSGRGLRDRGDQTKARIAEIEDPQPRPVASPAHLIHFRVANSLPTPQVGTNNLRMFVSESGDDLLISWMDKDRVLYRISNENGGWSDQREIKLSDSVTLDRAYEILTQRVRNH